MNQIEESFDATVFCKNRQRLLAHEVGKLFFDGVVKRAQGGGLISADHFTVDSTLIEAWASGRNEHKMQSSAFPPIPFSFKLVHPIFGSSRQTSEMHRCDQNSRYSE